MLKQIRPAHAWQRGLLTAAFVAATTFSALTVTPARAATADIGRFFATCGYFSVDTAVSGAANDGNNADKFRYEITDGAGKKLYREDSVRGIGQTAGSLVVNMSYDNDGADGQPGQNPITFAVIDLDANSNPTATLKTLKYDAGCLPASGLATTSNDFRPPLVLKGTIGVTTPLFGQPGGIAPINLSVAAGKEHNAVYRSADFQWVQIDIGGNDLVWIIASAMNISAARLNPQPTRIDLANPANIVTGPAPTVVAPGGGVVVIPPGAFATAQTTTRLRFRILPSTRATILDFIPRNTVVGVYGRNQASTWIKVGYNNLVGWVSTCCVRLLDASYRDLPIFLE
jgi:hypothetical protein